MKELAKVINEVVNLILGEGVNTSASDILAKHPEQFLNAAS